MADLDPVITASLRQINAGIKEHDQRVRLYDRSYDIYRASEPRARGVEPWQSKLRVPYAMQTIDTGMVNIVGGIPSCRVKPRHPDFEIGAKAMAYALDYYTAEAHLAETEAPFVQQALILGVTGAKVPWEYAEGPVIGRDEKTGKPKTEVIVKRDGPGFQPWNMYHCFWEPGARDVDSASYVVLQSYLTKDELLEKAVRDDGSGQYHNVAELLASGAAPTPRQTSQNRANHVGANYRYKDRFLVEEILTNDGIITMGNRQIVLRQQANPYWHGKKNFVICQARPDLFEMKGIASTELVDHLQQALWTVQNMRFDNLHLTVMRGITYRESAVTDPNQLELRPRFRWPVQDHDDIQPFQTQPLPPEAYNEENALLQRMQLVTGITPFVSGADLGQVDQNTATGVTALQQTASRLLRFMSAQIEMKGYQRMYEQWGAMVQQFMDKDIYMKVVHPTDGQDVWLNLKPEDVRGEFNYELTAAEDSLEKAQDRADAIALLNAFAPLIPTGQIKLKPILERVAEAYGIEDPDSLLTPTPPPPGPAAPMLPPGAPGGGQPPPPQPTGGTNPQNIQQLLGGQALNPQIQQAIQQGR